MLRAEADSLFSSSVIQLEIIAFGVADKSPLKWLKWCDYFFRFLWNSWKITPVLVYSSLKVTLGVLQNHPLKSDWNNRLSISRAENLSLFLSLSAINNSTDEVTIYFKGYCHPQWRHPLASDASALTELRRGNSDGALEVVRGLDAVDLPWPRIPSEPESRACHPETVCTFVAV